MTTQSVKGANNKEVKKVNLKKEIFAAPIRRQLLFDYCKAYGIHQRQGTVKTKTRGMVKGTTAKMYNQKGTGRARHGDAKANIFVGGGVVFGPTMRKWRRQLPQKARKRALISALSLRKKEGNLLIVDGFPSKEIKTKSMVEQLKEWGIQKVLMVTEEANEKIWKSARNIPNTKVVTADVLNAFDVMKFEKLAISEKALSKIEKRLS